MIKRILLLGSAGYMNEWVDKNKGRFPHYYLYAINNAWALATEQIHTWLFPNDFFKREQTVKPVLDQMIRWNTVRNFLDTPHWYNQKSSGTMILNALCHIINQNHGTNYEFYIAGCDLVYGTGNDHFYPGGMADPLRLGDDYLVTELARLKRKFEREGVEVYNVGDQEKTLLPFQRGLL